MSKRIIEAGKTGISKFWNILKDEGIFFFEKLVKISNFLFQKPVIIPLMVTLIYIFFHEKFEDLITSTIVENFLSFGKSSQVNDILVLLSLVGTLLYYISKISDRYIISYKFIYSLVILTIIYWHYRFCVDVPVWFFSSFTFSSRIKYLDIIPAFCFCTIFASIISELQLLRNNDSSISGFSEDKPISSSQDDLLNYKNYAKEIAQKIKASQFEKSFAIGITGEWGTGKSSFMNLLEEEIDNKAIIIKFNPWNSQSSKAIIQDFFIAFQCSIQKYHSSIPKLLSGYSDSLTNISEDNFSKLVNEYLKGFNQDSSIQDQLKEINEILKKIDRKIIVFIDDLDRLDKEEIFEVLKLIRNTGNFYNTFFIVAYDREYLIHAIQDINSHNSWIFLEKIFQFEVLLPPFEVKIIGQKLNVLLKNNIDKMDHHVFDELTLNSSIGKGVLLNDFLKSIRDVIRFTNSFCLHYKLLNGEIVFKELFFLELIRLRYPSVYKILDKRRNDFIKITERISGKYYYVLKRTASAGSSLEQKVEKYEIYNYLIDNQTPLNISEKEAEKITNLALMLFDDKLSFSEDNNRNISIKFPSSIDRYFHLRLLDGNISNIEFSNYRQKNFDEFKTKIIEWLSNDYGIQLRNWFEAINDFDNKDDFENIIKAIFVVGSYPFRHFFGTKDSIGYSARDLFNKLYNENNRIANLYYEGNHDKFKAFVLALFKDAKSPYSFESNLAHSFLIPEFEDFVITPYELKNLTIIYFEKYLDQTELLDSNVWYLFRCCEYTTAEEIGSGKRRLSKTIIPESKSLIIEFAKRKDTYNFLKDLIDYFGERKAISKTVDEIFESKEGFEVFLSELNEVESPFVKEFKDFYQKCKEFDFHYIDYSFSSFPNKIKK